MEKKTKELSIAVLLMIMTLVFTVNNHAIQTESSELLLTVKKYDWEQRMVQIYGCQCEKITYMMCRFEL